MKNLGQMLKQVESLQAKMAEIQAELARVEVTGASGAGMVRVTLNGKAEARKLAIDPSLMQAGEREVLEDLIVAAFNDAKAKVEAEVNQRMAQLTGGLPLPPGFKLPL
jgi:DNA-binding YbaB/EbfC family protein